MELQPYLSFPNGRADYRILACIFIHYRGSHKNYGGSSGGGGDGDEGGGGFGGAVVEEEVVKLVVMEVIAGMVSCLIEEEAGYLHASFNIMW